ncbi:hypothetical protein OG2516_05488 [Oceanicola granulosus HTCC2516]|uniref:SMP-30/Gluconolactonase/LRE-like region domain-containing protein n=1 Tax=Oceanicola granulosus (strain ATCC BAA-861 / DSM 15982 / KCTC 12143 / HTCC2516) TaxID=314256 RepID=Q2CIQ4_OCEGH|nr:SMP-30/gluconolactonase/LRE family protein [Oceanicola granulosus]EAR52535.1 hypothetical protein OG2516_05488 [Oceanicola granulosus HTCC2516]
MGDDASIEIHDERGAAQLPPDARPEKIADGCIWTEGPLVLPWDGSLLFSDIPNDRVMRWSEAGGLEVWKQPAHFANGRTLDAGGDILTCEHGARRVSRTRRDGGYEVVADAYEGRRLNSPNDVVAAADGSIWFTDPPYGIESDHEGHTAPSEQSGNYVYRVDSATGEVRIAADDFDRPNGLAFTPDGRRLYIADSGASRGAGSPDPYDPSRPHHIRVFDVAPDGTLSGGTVFVEIDAGVPDGLRIDAAGNVWTSAWDGVHVLAPDATPLLHIRLPAKTSNLTLDPTRHRLFITASEAVWRVPLG